MENPPGSSKIFPSNLQWGDAIGNLATRHWNNSQMSHPWWSWRMTWQKRGSLETMPMNSSGPMLWYVHRHGYIYIYIYIMCACICICIYIYISTLCPQYFRCLHAQLPVAQLRSLCWQRTWSSTRLHPPRPLNVSRITKGTYGNS